MTETTNYKFQKPGLDGAANIEVLDANWDKADAEIAKKADRQTASGGFEGGSSSVVVESGGAVGKNSMTNNGGSAGKSAVSSYGGAVGENAKTGRGFAGGQNAKTVDNNNSGIDAIQLGAGTNATPKSLQIYNYQLMDANGNIPTDRLRENVLTKTNTSVYSPTGDYHPATKKYVDDKAAAKADTSNVLTKTNTTAYTPTSNYHPATKKYVDDKAANIPVSAISGTVPVTKGGTGATTAAGALANLGIKIQTTVPASLNNGEIVFVVEV